MRRGVTGRSLLEALAADGVPGGGRTGLPAKLVVRGTTGPPAR